jgi:hypothetical protein
MALAATGFREENVFGELADQPTDIIVALGFEGRATLKIDDFLAWSSLLMQGSTVNRDRTSHSMYSMLGHNYNCRQIGRSLKLTASRKT